jgi:hypothetical protein
MNTRWILLIPLLLLALGSCGSPTAAEQYQDPGQLEIPTQETPPGLSENPLQSTNTLEATEMSSNFPPVEKYISLVKRDLASRLKINAEKIDLVKTKEMNWLNAALGCPSMGKFYAEGRVPGYQIWLEADGKEYDYHTDLDGRMILCPDAASTDSGPTPIIGVPID